MQMDQKRPLNILTRTDDEWKKYKYDVWPKARAWRMRFMEDIQGWSVENKFMGEKKREMGIGDIWQKYALKHGQTVALKVWVLTVQSQGLVSTEEGEKTQ